VAIGQVRVPTGIGICLPEGHVGRIGSRSGLSVAKNIEVGAGWIDPDYRGEIKVEMKNLSSHDLTVDEGARIAQLFILSVATPDLEETNPLPPSTRGAGGL